MNEYDLYKRLPHGFQPPHCDARVVHRPESCFYCDTYASGLQALREVQFVNYTGEYDPNKAPCPVEHTRTAKSAHQWPGNAPKSIEQVVYEDRARTVKFEDDLERRLAGDEFSEDFSIETDEGGRLTFVDRLLRWLFSPWKSKARRSYWGGAR
jgi:hypothetical protein